MASRILALAQIHTAMQYEFLGMLRVGSVTDMAFTPNNCPVCQQPWPHPDTAQLIKCIETFAQEPIEKRKVYEAMVRASEQGSKERHMVRETDITCDRCEMEKLVIESPGSETPTWLACHMCGQYHYFVGAVHCGNWYTGRLPNDEYVARLRAELITI